jgi:hypothetical protein
MNQDRELAQKVRRRMLQKSHKDKKKIIPRKRKKRDSEQDI